MDNSLKKNIIIYDMIMATFTTVITMLSLVIMIVLFKEFYNENKYILNYGIIGITIYRLYTIFIKPLIEVRVFSYSIDEKKVEYTKGAINKRIIIVPMRRIQQITSEKNPLLTRLGLVKINITTTTGTHSLRKISIKQGEEITDILTEKLHYELGRKDDKIK